MIYWQSALNSLRQGKTINQDDIDYKNELINRKIVREFNNYGIRISKKLIDYDDKNTDFSDIQEVNEETLKDGTNKIELPIILDSEIALWFKKSKINYHKIINSYLRTFYHTFQSVKHKD